MVVCDTSLIANLCFPLSQVPVNISPSLLEPALCLCSLGILQPGCTGVVYILFQTFSDCIAGQQKIYLGISGISEKGDTESINFVQEDVFIV